MFLSEGPFENQLVEGQPSLTELNMKNMKYEKIDMKRDPGKMQEVAPAMP